MLPPKPCNAEKEFYQSEAARISIGPLGPAVLQAMTLFLLNTCWNDTIGTAESTPTQRTLDQEAQELHRKSRSRRLESRREAQRCDLGSCSEYKWRRRKLWRLSRWMGVMVRRLRSLSWSRKKDRKRGLYSQGVCLPRIGEVIVLNVSHAHCHWL